MLSKWKEIKGQKISFEVGNATSESLRDEKSGTETSKMYINKDHSIVMNGEVIAEKNRETYSDFIIKNCNQLLANGQLVPSVKKAIPIYPKKGNVYYFEANSNIHFKTPITQDENGNIIPTKITMPNDFRTWYYIDTNEKLREDHYGGVITRHPTKNIIWTHTEYPCIIIITYRGNSIQNFCNRSWNFFSDNIVITFKNLSQPIDYPKLINLNTKTKFRKIIEGKVQWVLPIIQPGNIISFARNLYKINTYIENGDTVFKNKTKLYIQFLRYRSRKCKHYKFYKFMKKKYGDHISTDEEDCIKFDNKYLRSNGLASCDIRYYSSRNYKIYYRVVLRLKHDKLIRGPIFYLNRRKRLRLYKSKYKDK